MIPSSMAKVSGKMEPANRFLQEEEISGYILRRATSDDLETLVTLRKTVLVNANDLASKISLNDRNDAIRNFFKTGFDRDSCFTILAFSNTEIIGCGSVCFYNVMPTYTNPTGKNAYIMNMYVERDFRRRGIGNSILKKLIRHSQENGIVRITLEATSQGHFLYEKNGFVELENEMVFNDKHSPLR